MRMTTISMLTENRPGVLARVCHLFSRRGFNLLSVCAERTDRFEVYCITVVVRCDDDRTLEQICKQLRKLVDVEEVTILSNAPTIERQVALIKVGVEEGRRDALVEESSHFSAKVVDLSPKCAIFELVSDEFRIESFLKFLEPYRVIEVVRSGKIGLFRGERHSFANLKQSNPVAIPLPAGSLAAGERKTY